MAAESDSDLVFRLPAAAGADLVFGDDGPESDDIAVAVQGRLGRLALAVTATATGAPVNVAIRGQLRSLRMRASASYDNAVARGPAVNSKTAWQPAEAVARALAARHGDTQNLQSAGVAAWQEGVRRSEPTRVSMGVLQAAPRTVHSGWAHTQRTAAAAALAWALMVPATRRAMAVWQQVMQLGTEVRERWQQRIPRHRLRATDWQQAQALARLYCGGFSVALPRRRASRVRWQLARWPLHGVRTVEPPEPPEPCYVPSAHLVFDEAWRGARDLLFICERRGGGTAPVVVPVLRSYIVVNDVVLVRVADGLLLEALTLSLTFDADSWTGSFQATLPATAMDDVMPAPDPVLLEASINGQAFRVLVESVSRSRRFGERRLQISGRGWAAELGSPQSPSGVWSNSELRTAQQLAAEVLPLGWSLDWQIEDWLVPAGVWSFQGAPIDAVKRIAEAAGGYVRSARAARQLSVLHRYPTAPWEWGDETLALVLPPDPVSVEGIAMQDKALYNAVYVSGEGAGYLGHVKRQGTAGDRVAPMVTDALMTDAAAIRQRGRAVLSDVGRQSLVTLELQVLPETGVIDVGTFLEYSDGDSTRRGLVRGSSVSVTRPKVRQTVEVETHA